MANGVLVIDDNPTNRLILRETLHVLGIENRYLPVAAGRALPSPRRDGRGTAVFAGHHR